MRKASKIKSFDPNSPANANAQLYCLPFNVGEAEIVSIPVPWGVATRYGGGTSRWPEAIFDWRVDVELVVRELL